MFKRSVILCTLLASSTMFATESESVASANQMQLMLTAITKKYDQAVLKKYEEKIENAFRSYLYDCIADETKIKNIHEIEKAAKELLGYLIIVGERDEAYSATSMIFILSWTKIINELAKTITTEKEVENLQEATDLIRDLVEKMFLEPMNEMIEEEEEN